MIIEDLRGENIEVRTDKDNPRLDSTTEVFPRYKTPLGVETYYESSFIDAYPRVLFEFDYTPSRAFLTEKVYKPIQYGHMFIPFGMKGTMRCLQNLRL